MQKAAPAIARSDKFAPKEMELAKTLVNTLAGPFKPEQYHDEYRENVERLLQAKQRGEKVRAVSQPKTRPVVNIMEAPQRRQSCRPIPLVIVSHGPAAVFFQRQTGLGTV